MDFLIKHLVQERVIYKSTPWHTYASGEYFSFCWISWALGQTTSFKLLFSEFLFYACVAEWVIQVSNSGASTEECLIYIGMEISFLG